MTERPHGPDYAYAATALRLSNLLGFALRTGLDREAFEAWWMLTDAIYTAITSRGARFSEIVEAVHAVRVHGSILDDLPVADTLRAKPPMPPSDR